MRHAESNRQVKWRGKGNGLSKRPKKVKDGERFELG
jgi:hypothetical protein